MTKEEILRKVTELPRLDQAKKTRRNAGSVLLLLWFPTLIFVFGGELWFAVPFTVSLLIFLISCWKCNRLAHTKRQYVRACNLVWIYMEEAKMLIPEGVASTRDAEGRQLYAFVVPKKR